MENAILFMFSKKKVSISWSSDNTVLDFMTSPVNNSRNKEICAHNYRSDVTILKNGTSEISIMLTVQEQITKLEKDINRGSQELCWPITSNIFTILLGSYVQNLLFSTCQSFHWELERVIFSLCFYFCVCFRKRTREYLQRYILFKIKKCLIWLLPIVFYISINANIYI